METPNPAGEERRARMDFLGEIPDQRMARTRDHKRIDVLVIGACCLMSGGEGFNDMESFGKAKREGLETFLELPEGIPSHDTFNRVFRLLKPKVFMDVFVRWTQTLRSASNGEIVALDGKALRRACRKGESMTDVVSAWAADNGLTLGQVKVKDKSNENPAIPELLRMLELGGCIVTIDAMGCQKKIAKEIKESDAEYVLALKGNQETVHDEVRLFFNELIPPDPAFGIPPPPPEAMRYLQTQDGDPGRIETRRFWLSNDVSWFAERDKWEGLHCFGMAESLREIGSERSYERRFFLASIEHDVACFAKACRSHWGVENPLHWTLDVTLREDNSRARSGHAAENLAAVRRLALNVFKKNAPDPSLSTRRRKLMAGWNNDYLGSLLGI